MPYLRFELDAKRLVPSAARAANIPEAVMGWGLMDLWEWCWREKTDAASALVLSGFFGTSESVPAALVAFGFLEDLGDGTYRVRGAAKYLRVSESRRSAGVARAASATRDSAGRLTSKTPAHAGASASKPPARDQLLHPFTQTPIHPTPGETFAGGPPDAPRQEPLLSAPKGKKADPRHAPLTKALVEAFSEAVGAKYGHAGGKDAKAVERLLGLAGEAGPDEVLARWRRSLKAVGFDRCATFHDLAEKWNRLPGAGPPKSDVRRGRVGAEEFAHEKTGDLTHEF